MLSGGKGKQRRMARRVRFWRRALWLLLALPPAAWLGLRFIVAPWAVGRALAAAGLQPATFSLSSVGLEDLRIKDLKVGPGEPWLTAGTVHVSYSLPSLGSRRVKSITVSDSTWTVHIRGGAVEWGPSPHGGKGLSIDFPFDQVDLTAARIVVKTATDSYDLPMSLSLSSLAPDHATAHLSLAPPGGAVEIQADAHAGQAGITIEAGTSVPATLAVDDGVSAAFQSISARLTLPSPGGRPEGTISVRGGSLRAGGIGVAELATDIAVHHDIEVGPLSATVGDGGTLSAEPFAVDPAAPVIRTRISLGNLSLAEWLPLLSKGHATGEGRVGGTVGLVFDVAAGTLTDLTGELAADPQQGVIQVGDAEALGDLLDAQDPRFATDEVMRPVRDKIVSAFRDFAFSKLTVGLSREGGHSVASAFVSGFGRHGEDPQGLNLTLNLHVDDALLALALQLASLGKVNSAAGSALERFFETPKREPERGPDRGEEKP
jgi:hypothetical protein